MTMTEAELEGLALPLDQLQKARLLLAACRTLDETPAGCRTQAYEDAARRLALMLRVSYSAKSMQRVFNEWLKSGRDALAAVDKRYRAGAIKATRSRNGLFRTYVKELFYKYQRNGKAAHAELVRRLQSGMPIPGYEDWRRMDANGLVSIPPGWSYRQIARLFPTKEEAVLAKHGMRAGARYLPQVFRTRAGSYPCAFVAFDDVHLDVKTIARVNGTDQIGRPLQLGCNDVFTGRRLCWGTKFSFEREDGTRAGLNGDEMLYILCDYLVNVGYSPRGTVLLVENQTASISREIEEQLLLLTGGCVRVKRGGMHGSVQAMLHEFGGKSCGNPRNKAYLESYHNPQHNRLSFLPGATGHDRTEPEWLWGMEREQRKISKAKDRLPAEKAAMLEDILLPFHEVCSMLPSIVADLNGRTDHDLEGWADCGFFRQEYSFDPSGGQWGDLSQLDADQKNFLLQLEARSKGHIRMRRMSPQEAWDSSMRNPVNTLVKLSIVQAAELLGIRMARDIRANGSYFYIQDRKLAPGKLIYDRELVTPDGYLKDFGPRIGYKGIINPFDLGKMYVLDERDVVLGYAPLVQRGRLGDDEALRSQLGRAKSQTASRLQDMRVTRMNEEAAIVARREHNASIIQGTCRTPQERLEDGEARRAERRIAARQKGLPRMDDPPPRLPPDNDLPETNY
ncbi:hypothetical protein [Akkermansia glycaniphila]|uniref:Uncharacterized protein n=1 Tax=Akkermansia glycaniphila TaxID=1679444 RepID=A0A1H6LQS5_9BACT|nr:hypothetical protein [Akkermansia glycaniphila]SEH87320.1 Hypothetical protein PYTT_1362 [Akkermansia glycaniphila]